MIFWVHSTLPLRSRKEIKSVDSFQVMVANKLTMLNDIDNEEPFTSSSGTVAFDILSTRVSGEIESLDNPCDTSVSKNNWTEKNEQETTNCNQRACYTLTDL